jgi:phage shock protein PspC (stress-responsive transcriptional regulator)
MTLKRNVNNKVIAGVCSGLANEMGIDPLIMRLVFILSVLLGFGIGIIIYLLMWILMPTA